MRRAAKVAVVALLMCGTSAFADEVVVTTGADLLTACREFADGRYPSRGVRTGVCAGAVYSALTLLPNLCAPHDLTLRQAVQVVANYMLRHTEQQHMDITLLSVYALTEAWPCEKRP